MRYNNAELWTNYIPGNNAKILIDMENRVKRKRLRLKSFSVFSQLIYCNRS